MGEVEEREVQSRSQMGREKIDNQRLSLPNLYDTKSFLSSNRFGFWYLSSLKSTRAKSCACHTVFLATPFGDVKEMFEGIGDLAVGMSITTGLSVTVSAGRLGVLASDLPINGDLELILVLIFEQVGYQGWASSIVLPFASREVWKELTG